MAAPISPDRRMVRPADDTPRRLTPRPRRRGFLLVLGALLAMALGVLASANAAPAPAAAAPGQLAPQQAPPLPLPPNPGCMPGSPEPACHLPTASQQPTIPATPLPPITTLPGPGPSCFPGSVLPGCAPSLEGPCAGPDCIPQPSTLAP
ncbi:hypothetical protein PV458_05200, partial [Streptomyces sp. MN03-5084-2B]|nr:hypothetical protein [Streptomyces sp. MN03-5084-2B]